MAHIDWQGIMNGQQTPKKRYSGANVRFFNAYNENEEKTLKEGRPIFDEIPSISIQFPGMDETVRRIEPQDIRDYPDKYAAFKAGSEPVTEGTPIAEWALMSGSAMRELQYLGFKTVEQLANASDEAKRKLGTLGKFAKLAKDWLDAAKSDQNEVVKLKQLLEREQARTAKLEEKLELFMQRVEANEGTDLRSHRREVIQSTEVVDELDDVDETDEPVKRRGRPRKV
jgi:hypothetical protein|tara:strand:- start:3144 stop:3824 length:681 start_codon:yes stop_codon:yes gene_type:complete